MLEANRRSAAAEVLEKEKGLSRTLSTRQMAMIAIGGAIGTGLFLGSSLAVHTAGPAVILSYLLGAILALLLMGTLSEMAVAHPTAGSFGVYAELYVNRWAGFVVRYTYWACQCIAIGGEATAVAIYCGWWFPQIAPWVWIVLFSLLLVIVNASGVEKFGEFEYWFAMIKVVAILAFIGFGVVVLLGFMPSAPSIGLRNFSAGGGFFAHGVSGIWLAMCFVIFSYIGTEVVAVTAGEAEVPDVAVPKAMRQMVLRLILFYIGSMIVLIGVVPWTGIQPSANVTASPFVTVFRMMHIPAATNVMNFVVLTAALSSMNCDLYLATRMIFSLSRGGYAPRGLGWVTKRGVPVPALLLSTTGLVVATIIAIVYPSSAYVYLFGIALFGGLFVWFMIFVTHLFFRRAWKAQGGRILPVQMIGYPYTSLLGAALVAGIIATTWWVPGMRPTLFSGLPWLVLLTIAYLLWGRKRGARPVESTSETLPENANSQCAGEDR
ncbi:MAG TPA: amino acid permease [Candidatus Acidoferrales bacterium]|nr:amino acid permease [Candidatus Acidoferrales bacterium]